MALALIFECEALPQQGDDECQLFSCLKWSCFGVKLIWKLDTQRVAPQEKEGV